MGQIEKGVILSFGKETDESGNNKTASVQSVSADGTSTMPITIPSNLRGAKGMLKKGTEVVYAVFDDESGVILCRIDGEQGGDS